MNNQEKDFFDTEGLAEYFSISKKSVEKWRYQKRIPGAYQVGRVWRFRKTEIEKRLLSGKLLLDKVR